MSKICTKIICHNRISIGNINDPDVINYICPKCEEVYYISDIRKKRVWKNYKNLFLFLLLVVITTGVWYNYDKIIELTNLNNTEIPQEDIDMPFQKVKDTLSKSNQVKKVMKELEFSAKIIGLVEAEELRDFYQIKDFYAKNITVYYGSKNITQDQLKEHYLRAWQYTKYSSNRIEKIIKINKYNYIMHTRFTYYINKKGKESSEKSVIKFIFNESGKIIYSDKV